MSSDAPAAVLDAVAFVAADPPAQVRFWSSLLGWDASGDTVTGPGGYPLRFRPGAAPGPVRNHLHPDLTSTSVEDQRGTVARALALGARHADVGQRPDEPHVVLADPEGNAFCVLEPGNGFVAGCGVVGALACDGTSAVGRFWSSALRWPLVWDRDEETAVQAPGGGTKISWGGWAPDPRSDRVRLEVRGDADRLVALGATRTADPSLLADPDGVVFAVRPR